MGLSLGAQGSSPALCVSFFTLIVNRGSLSLPVFLAVLGGLPYGRGGRWGGGSTGGLGAGVSHLPHEPPVLLSLSWLSNIPFPAIVTSSSISALVFLTATRKSRVAALTALSWFLAVTAQILYSSSLRCLWSLLTRHFSLSWPLCGPIAMGPPFLGVPPRTAEAALGSFRPMLGSMGGVSLGVGFSCGDGLPSRPG